MAHKNGGLFIDYLGLENQTSQTRGAEPSLTQSVCHKVDITKAFHICVLIFWSGNESFSRAGVMLTLHHAVLRITYDDLPVEACGGSVTTEAPGGRSWSGSPCCVSYLGSCALQLHQPVLQPLDFGNQLHSFLGQQVLVEFDLLQEGLRGGVIVAPLSGQVHLGHLVDSGVHIGHEEADGGLHFWL